MIIYLLILFLLFTMPIWLPLLVFGVKYGKEKDLVVSSDIQQEKNIFKFLLNKNKWVFLNFILSAILLVMLYYFLRPTEENCYENFLCGVMTVPIFISAFITILVLIFKLIFNTIAFYFPNRKENS